MNWILGAIGAGVAIFAATFFMILLQGGRIWVRGRRTDELYELLDDLCQKWKLDSTLAVRPKKGSEFVIVSKKSKGDDDFVLKILIKNTFSEKFDTGILRTELQSQGFEVFQEPEGDEFAKTRINLQVTGKPEGMFSKSHEAARIIRCAIEYFELDSELFDLGYDGSLLPGAVRFR